MTFVFFRIWASIAVITIFIVCIRGWKQIKKRYVVIPVLIVFSVCCLCLNLFRVENFFMTFRTPEEIFQYEYVSGTIQAVAQGKDSCMILYTKTDGTYSYMICSKNEKGYKITSDFSFKKIYKKISLDAIPIFEVYNVRDTNDFYVVCWFHSPEVFISDNRNTELEKIKDGDIVITYGYVENMNNDYYMLINNEPVYIMN